MFRLVICLPNSVCMGDVYGVIHVVRYLLTLVISCIEFSVDFSSTLLMIFLLSRILLLRIFLALDLLTIKFTPCLKF